MKQFAKKMRHAPTKVIFLRPYLQLKPKETIENKKQISIVNEPNRGYRFGKILASNCLLQTIIAVMPDIYEQKAKVAPKIKAVRELQCPLTNCVQFFTFQQPYWLRAYSIYVYTYSSLYIIQSKYLSSFSLCFSARYFGLSQGKTFHISMVCNAMMTIGNKKRICQVDAPVISPLITFNKYPKVQVMKYPKKKDRLVKAPVSVAISIGEISLMSIGATAFISPPIMPWPKRTKMKTLQFLQRVEKHRTIERMLKLSKIYLNHQVDTYAKTGEESKLEGRLQRDLRLRQCPAQDFRLGQDQNRSSKSRLQPEN